MHMYANAGAEDSQTSSDNIPAVAELQQALARSGEELASKEAQLQEVCQVSGLDLTWISLNG